MTGIEYMYEGRGIVSMRFKMHFAGFSPWLGVKTSLATLTSYLDVEMAPPQEFDKYISVLPEERRRPACLRAFVVGFAAVWTGSRLSAISLVVRKVRPFGPPGNALSSPVGAHIQAHQPFLSRNARYAHLALLEMRLIRSRSLTSRHANPPFGIPQVRCWPAWKCVTCVEIPSHPGTPTLFKVKDQNIFSYFWVQDALDAEAKAAADAKVRCLGPV